MQERCWNEIVRAPDPGPKQGRNCALGRLPEVQSVFKVLTTNDLMITLQAWPVRLKRPGTVLVPGLLRSTGVTDMRFVFDARKTAQAARCLIALDGGTMNYMVLIKLLYLADRRSLIETGMPISGDRMVAMPHGPVLSRTYDQINMGAPPETDEGTAWYEYITEPSDYDVSSRGESRTDQLSHYELDLLGETFERFGRMSRWALRDYTHTLPEWVDPHGSSLPIEPETILRAHGKSSEEIERRVEDAEEMWFIGNLAKITH